VTSFFRLAAIAVLFGVLSACAVSQERKREARLMPEKVIQQIIGRYVGIGWARSPTARAHLPIHPLCNDKKVYPMPYSTMQVVWDPWFVEVWGDQHEVGFWCFYRTWVRFNVSDTQGRDDLIDALVSLGAKIKTN
jgi:hypothetical protein